MTHAEVCKLIDAAATLSGSRKRWCEKNGISPGYVADVVSGRREAGEKVLAALGIRRVVTYERAD